MGQARNLSNYLYFIFFLIQGKRAELFLYRNSAVLLSHKGKHLKRFEFCSSFHFFTFIGSWFALWSLTSQYKVQHTKRPTLKNNEPDIHLINKRTKGIIKKDYLFLCEMFKFSRLRLSFPLSIHSWMRTTQLSNLIIVLLFHLLTSLAI